MMPRDAAAQLAALLHERQGYVTLLPESGSNCVSAAEASLKVS